MKHFFLFCLLAAGFSATAQNATFKLPSVQVKDINGNTVSTDKFSNNGKPMIINFWATWCKPCVLELSTIADDYEDWVKATGVKLIAVSIDDSRNTAKVGPMAKGRGWEYEIYLDPNEDFKRAMNVNNPPHTFVVNGNGEVVWQHIAYQPGDEKALYEVVKKVAAGLPPGNH